MHNWQKQTLNDMKVRDKGLQVTGLYTLTVPRKKNFLVHDDLTLVLDERFEECEISKCKTVLAINLCLENSDPRNEFNSRHILSVHIENGLNFYSLKVVEQ